MIAISESIEPIGVLTFLIETINDIDPQNELLAQLLNARDKDGNTVFALATKFGQTKIIETLISSLTKANINLNDYISIKNNKGETPLMLAIIHGKPEIVNLLIENSQADPEHKLLA